MRQTTLHQRFRPFYPLLLLAIFALSLNSCVAIKTAPEPTVERPVAVKVPPRVIPRPPTVSRTSRTHTVAPGETLWRISKVYDVPIAAITRANRIKGDSDLLLGQNLNIPNAKAPEQVISLYPSHKWKYIIVHHSATREGSSLQFNIYHQSKGWDSVGYHFVIDNGQSDKTDGFIEITPRWLKQLDGAHCKAGEMNTQGIGICLVGDFNDERVTDAQMTSLVFLVNKLRKYYKIPARNILGHRDVHGANTDCPGRHFPWSSFKQKLR